MDRHSRPLVAAGDGGDGGDGVSRKRVVRGTDNPQFDKARRREVALVDAAHDAVHAVRALLGVAQSELAALTLRLKAVAVDAATRDRTRDARLRRDEPGAGTWPVKLLALVVAGGVGWVLYNNHRALLASWPIPSSAALVIVVGLSLLATFGAWISGVFAKQRWATRAIADQDALRRWGPIVITSAFLVVETLLALSRAFRLSEALRPLTLWAFSVGGYFIDGALAFWSEAPWKRDAEATQNELTEAQEAAEDSGLEVKKLRGDLSVAIEHYITTAGHAGDAIESMVDTMAAAADLEPNSYSYPVDVERYGKVATGDLSACEECASASTPTTEPGGPDDTPVQSAAPAASDDKGTDEGAAAA
jgi:hypothetical protein